MGFDLSYFSNKGDTGRSPAPAGTANKEMRLRARVQMLVACAAAIKRNDEIYFTQAKDCAVSIFCKNLICFIFGFRAGIALHNRKQALSFIQGIMVVILGVIFHFIGGFALGSFYMPYKKVKGLALGKLWIVGGLFSWLIVPPLAAYLTIPGFADIISNSPAKVVGSTFLMGLLWGIGGLTYGLGVRYLGVSLGSSIILGLCSVFGALIPSVYYYFNPTAGKDTIADLFGNTWGLMVLLGLAICVIGIIICGKAGAMKDAELCGAQTDASGSEFKIGLGLFVSIVSGVLSACFGFGIEAGSSMGIIANTSPENCKPGPGRIFVPQ